MSNRFLSAQNMSRLSAGEPQVRANLVITTLLSRLRIFCHQWFSLRAVEDGPKACWPPKLWAVALSFELIELIEPVEPYYWTRVLLAALEWNLLIWSWNGLEFFWVLSYFGYLTTSSGLCLVVCQVGSSLSGSWKSSSFHQAEYTVHFISVRPHKELAGLKQDLGPGSIRYWPYLVQAFSGPGLWAERGTHATSISI